MNWFISALTSGVGRKVIMALTGLFLILFLIVHLLGNLQLLKDDGGEAFNVYTHFMAHNGLIQLISKLNFFFILLHAFVSYTLYVRNKKARPVGYKVNGASANSSWSSRSMTLLGTLIFIFLLVHLQGFWYAFKFGSGIPTVTIDGVEMHDAYKWVAAAYANPVISGFYVFSMIVLAFHLWHGFSSAFQSLGLNHVKYTGFIKALGYAYAIIVPGLFAIIPIVLYLKR
ncbi:MAG TPA: succinate dehydrogenase cytochrome b subunit [Flammeovirgaceae bacterium]|nr:succinate dehydrogenase cytochrome b subunit [Flammeovirgaceae bacterium]